ncbi:MAG: phosphopantothenoylcysteine decarboxylase, partial [Microcystis panniformis]
MTWNFSSPTDSDLGDREVPLENHHLWGKRIALLVTGGIAAMKAPLIARSLRKFGA